MNTKNELRAFSSEEKVQDIATIILRMSDTIHDALRRLSTNVIDSSPISSYALLTEEYALRARARIILEEAKRLVIQDFEMSQEELISLLTKIKLKFNTVSCIEDLSELLVGMMLFSNSIVSKKSQIISFLLDDLKQLQ
jgi:hypothetical protein